MAEPEPTIKADSSDSLTEAYFRLKELGNRIR
jgi:hypothetical protein